VKCCFDDLVEAFTGFARVITYIYKSGNEEPGISSSFNDGAGEVDRLLYIYEGVVEGGDSSGFGRFIHGYLDFCFIGYF